jgi:hypothetical protein
MNPFSIHLSDDEAARLLEELESVDLDRFPTLKRVHGSLGRVFDRWETAQL